MKNSDHYDIIDKSISEAEAFDASMLLLDSASLHFTNMEQQTGSNERPSDQVVARSYEIDVLKRALKNQLTQIKGRVEKECIYPRRSEKRNFRFGKSDVIHE